MDLHHRVCEIPTIAALALTYLFDRLPDASARKSLGSWLTKTTVLPHFPRTMNFRDKSSEGTAKNRRSRQVPADAGAF